MKKVISGALFSLFAFICVSCSNDTEASSSDSGLFPKTIKEFYQDGTQVGDFTGSYKYDGNKLVEIYYNQYMKTLYYYTGDLITKTEYIQASTIRFSDQFTYENSKLTNYFRTDLLTGRNTAIDYVHNNDGTINYVEKIISNTKQVESTEEGVLEFHNGNLIKDVSVFRYSSTPDEKIEMENQIYYDENVNPHKNILGYNFLLPLKGTIGNNNIKADYTFCKSYKGTNLVSEWLIAKEYNFTYDKRGFPTQMDRYTNESVGGKTLYLDRIFKYTY